MRLVWYKGEKKTGVACQMHLIKQKSYGCPVVGRFQIREAFNYNLFIFYKQVVPTGTYLRGCVGSISLPIDVRMAEVRRVRSGGNNAQITMIDLLND